MDRVGRLEAEIADLKTLVDRQEERLEAQEERLARLQEICRRYDYYLDKFWESTFAVWQAQIVDGDLDLAKERLDKLYEVMYDSQADTD